jgi:parallel beta-helix repeat protein
MSPFAFPQHVRLRRQPRINQHTAIRRRCNEVTMKRFVCLSMAALGWMVLPAHAHADACVTAGDSATLTNLLNNVSPNQATDLTIRLERGTYTINTFISSYAKHALALRGGYDAGAGCNGGRAIEPTGTVVDFNGNSAVITSETGNPSSAGSVVLEAVTLRHGSHLNVSAGYLNVDPYDFSKDKAGSVTISHTRISDFASGADAPLNFETVKGTLTLDNSLIDSIVNSAPNQLCAISLGLGANTTVNMRYLTAALYGARDFCLKSEIRDGTYNINLQNSIVYEADNAGGSAIRAVPWAGTTNTWQFNVTASVLQNYIDQNGNYSPPAGANANYPNFIDGLNVDPNSRDFHVLYNSVAINTGNPNVAGSNGTDMIGNPRQIGSKPDAWAYESQIDDTISYVVTNTADSGAGSLRAAVAFANKNNDPNTITFNLPCPSVIQLSSPLNIDNPLVINGYSNPGAAINNDVNAFNAKLCVVIEEQSLGNVAWAFNVFAQGGGLTVRGLAFDGFYQPIHISGGYGHEITGNQFGGHLNGAFMAGPLNNAISVHGISTGLLKIGGVSPGERNVIAGAVHDGIVLDNTVTTSNCHIDNNLIGLDANGLGEIGNGHYGVLLQSKGCMLTQNRIAANASGGIYVQNDNNVLQTNTFGMNVQGNATNSPGWAVVVNGNGNALGPRMTDSPFAPSLGNIAVFMGSGGFEVINRDRNAVRANLIDFNGPQHDRSVDDIWVSPFANQGEKAPAIDSMSLPNGLPISAKVSATASAHVDSSAFTSFRIDAYYSDYCAPNGKGHAQWYLGTQVITTNNAGHATFSMPLQLPKSPATSAVSMTATDMTGNTSDYSECFPIDAIFKNGLDP